MCSCYIGYWEDGIFTATVYPELISFCIPVKDITPLEIK